MTTPDGTCGGTTGFTCEGYGDANCCSQYGYCGSTADYCDVGCDAAFGQCGTSPSTTPPYNELPTSHDARCGSFFQESCLNSGFGDCCSQYGYCGSSGSYCGTGCQSEYGSCTGSVPFSY